MQKASGNVINFAGMLTKNKALEKIFYFELMMTQKLGNHQSYYNSSSGDHYLIIFVSIYDVL